MPHSADPTKNEANPRTTPALAQHRGSHPIDAIVLLSGGLDSATTLAIARHQGRCCATISVDYGQRHRAELIAAERVSRSLGASSHHLVPIDLARFGGSALTDEAIRVPKAAPETPAPPGIPITYVPARNLIFLALATALAEVSGAEEIFIGVNAVDYSGYPDCRPEFIEAFQRAATLATKAGVEGAALRVRTPLIEMPKAEIIRTGAELGVDFAETVSCYDADNEARACGRCDACRIRRRGFADAGLPDTTIYRPNP